MTAARAQSIESIVPEVLRAREVGMDREVDDSVKDQYPGLPVVYRAV